MRPYSLRTRASTSRTCSSSVTSTCSARSPGASVAQVDADDGRALALEQLHGRGADAAARAGHHAHAPGEPSRCGHHPSVA